MAELIKKIHTINNELFDFQELESLRKSKPIGKPVHSLIGGQRVEVGRIIGDQLVMERPTALALGLDPRVEYICIQYNK